MTQKRILFIQDYPPKEGGGVETQTYLDALQLSKIGYQVVIGATRHSSETFVSSETYPLVVNDRLRIEYIETLEQLQKLIEWAGIVHVQATFSLRPGMMTALKVLQNKSEPYIVALHTSRHHIPFSRLFELDDLSRQNLLLDFAEYLKNDRCTVLGVSHSQQETLDWLGVKKSIQVIHNAKDWEGFKTNEKAGDIEPTDLLFIGENSWMKGMYLLIDLIVLLRREFSDIKLRILGEGQNKKDALSIICSLGLENNIEFVGYVKNQSVANYLSRSKILIVPSLTEAWGNVPMEGLAMGNVVVASRTEGLIELLGDGRHGLLFERGNPYDLYEKVRSVLVDDKIYQKFAQKKISDTIRNTYSVTNRVDQLGQLYLSL